MPLPNPFGDDEAVGDKLQKFLSAAGVASRRHAEEMIKQGRVSVNGTRAELGMRVVEGDEVRVGGVVVGPQAPRYVILNKPDGVVTTADDPEGRRTVVELVESSVRLYPVGRLDYHTTGIILMTNDGGLAHRMMHPSFGVDKVYRVLVEGKVSTQVVRQLATGVELDDGPTAPAKAHLVQAGDDKSLIELTIHEGRNRQVRRMMDAVGHPVMELVRVGYGPLTLGDLAPGTSRDLTAAEIRRLYKAAGMAPKRHKERPGAGDSDSDSDGDDAGVTRGAKPPKRANRDKRDRPAPAGGSKPAPARGQRGPNPRPEAEAAASHDNRSSTTGKPSRAARKRQRFEESGGSRGVTPGERKPRSRSAGADDPAKPGRPRPTGKPRPDSAGKPKPGAKPAKPGPKAAKPGAKPSGAPKTTSKLKTIDKPGAGSTPKAAKPKGAAKPKPPKSLGKPKPKAGGTGKPRAGGSKPGSTGPKRPKR